MKLLSTNLRRCIFICLLLFGTIVTVHSQEIIPNGPIVASTSYNNTNGAVIQSGSIVTVSSAFSLTFNYGLRIQEGATLIVNGATIRMADNQEIILEQSITATGAHLILNNGSVITSLTSTPTGNHWKGINVDAVPGPVYINMLPLLQMNGATVQYANCAYTNYGFNTGFSVGLGRLHAINSSFLNNVRCLDIGYTAYGWYPSNNTIEWVGNYARDCTFKLTADFPVVPPDMIRMKYGALGLHSCNFIAQSVLHAPPAPDVINFSYVNNTTAIDAQESLVWIEQAIGSPSGCEFEGFKNGLVVDNINTPYPTTVSNSTFACIYGINASNTMGSLMIGNQFTGPITATEVSPYVSPNNCAIYADNCEGVHIEGNSIEYDYNPYTNCFGIVDRNSGEIVQNIYRNSVQVLTTGVGIESVGWNRSSTGTDGLKILCNFVNNPSDFLSSFNIAVMRDPTGGNGNNPQGICDDQFGTWGESAANLFSSNTSDPYSSYYLEPGTNNISVFTYKFNPAVFAEKPPYTNILNLSTTTANSCPVMTTRYPQDTVTLLPISDTIKILISGPDTSMQQRPASGASSAQIKAFNNMANVQKWLIAHRDNWYAMPADLKAQVYNAETNDQAQGSRAAKALLHRYEGKQYDPVLVMPKPVIAILPTTGLKISIYPNPAHDKIKVTWQGDKATLRIVNIKGQACLTKTIEKGSNAIDLNGLAAGTYIVQILNADNKNYTQMLIVK